MAFKAQCVAAWMLTACCQRPADHSLMAQRWGLIECPPVTNNIVRYGFSTRMKAIWHCHWDYFISRKYFWGITLHPVQPSLTLWRTCGERGIISPSQAARFHFALQFALLLPSQIFICVFFVFEEEIQVTLFPFSFPSIDVFTFSKRQFHLLLEFAFVKWVAERNFLQSWLPFKIQKLFVFPGW